MEIKERRLALIEDTMNHFNTTNRAIKKNIHGGNMCTYAPVDGVSSGCAIGRLITDKALCFEMDEFDTSVDDDKIIARLPSEVKKLGISFLSKLQQLHDQEKYWNSLGLSVQGVVYADNLKDEFCQTNL